MMTKHAPSQHWIELLFDALLALLIALAIAAAQPAHAVESTSPKLGGCDLRGPWRKSIGSGFLRL